MVKKKNQNYQKFSKYHDPEKQNKTKSGKHFMSKLETFMKGEKM